MIGFSPGGKKVAKNICGGALILLGIIGLALPILQGVALIVAGFLMLDFAGKERLIMRARELPGGRWLEARWHRIRRRPGTGSP